MIIPFIELPCSFIESNKEIAFKLKVYPMSIIAYLEQPNGHTAIYLNNGQMFVLKMAIEDYEQAISIFFKETSKINGSKIHKLN
jgi:hypothetical protein